MQVSLLSSLAAVALIAAAPEQAVHSTLLAANDAPQRGVLGATLSASGGSEALRDTALSASSSVPDRAVLDETLSAGGVPGEALRDEALAALAPAPEKVVRTTRSFGTVTIDHRAHLARKAHCIQCHGPGPVTKLVFTPRVAHDRCIGCHREQKAGPMNCRECHTVKPPEPTTLMAKAPDAAKTPGATSPTAVNPTALASAAPGVPRAPPAPAFAPVQIDERVERDHRFTRVLAAGFAGSSAGSELGGGPAFYFTARQDGWLMSVSVENSGRTVGLIGAGAVFPVYRRFNAVAQGVGGFDAAQKPGISMAPALGGRVGVEWMGNRTTAGLSLTGLTDLASHSDPVGGNVSAFSMSLAATVGWVIAD